MNAKDACGMSLVLSGGVEHVTDVAIFELA
jgi:hypothetical protein